jgi:hypothetical protein
VRVALRHARRLVAWNLAHRIQVIMIAFLQARQNCGIHRRLSSLRLRHTNGWQGAGRLCIQAVAHP